jgi:hypothetical protein
VKKLALGGFVVGLLALLTGLVPATAHADPSTGFGPFGREILANPVPGPVLPAPNVFPLPPPLPSGTGLVPAPVLPGRHTFPVPAPANGVQDGPGSGPIGVQPGRVDAGKPANAGRPEEPGSAGDPPPVGKLSRVDVRFLERKGLDAHEEKESVGLVPASRYDIYVDQKGSMYGVRKGANPKGGRYIGPLPE